MKKRLLLGSQCTFKKALWTYFSKHLLYLYLVFKEHYRKSCLNLFESPMSRWFKKQNKKTWSITVKPGALPLEPDKELTHLWRAFKLRTNCGTRPSPFSATSLTYWTLDSDLSMTFKSDLYDRDKVSLLPLLCFRTFISTFHFPYFIFQSTWFSILHLELFLEN